MRVVISRALWLVWAVFISFANADDRPIIIVKSDFADQPTSLANTLHQQLANSITTLITPDRLSDPAPVNALYLATDEAALRALLALDSAAPILAVFISKLEYLEATSTLSPAQAARVSALYPDPDPAMQLKLLRLLRPNATRVGLLLGPASARLAPEITAAGRDQSMTVIVQQITGPEDLYPTLNKLADVSAILAIPDHDIYNKSTLRTLLLTTYRRGQPLIGYSPGMVKSGAMATVMCDTHHIGEQVLRWIEQYQRERRLPSPRYCDSIDLLLNTSVLKSLDIVAAPKEALLLQLRQAEGDPP